ELANRSVGRPDFTVRTFLDPVDVLYTLTEIYEFASRLAGRGVLGATSSIDISLIGTRDRVLWITDPRRAWLGFYRCTQEDLVRPTRRPTAVELIEGARDLALEAALWFYERFGWEDPPVTSLRDDQTRFLARAI
ncbi:MAG TPA: hypothetical protein PKD27_07930, partial [Tepidiformaceae bacterium]|nr:hypothetical protein [Tepidiformaceae bacterium]